MAAPLIRSRSNAVVRRFRALKERAGGDLALLEGTKLVEEALAAGATVTEVAASPRAGRTPRGRALLEALDKRHVPVSLMHEDVLASVSEAETSQGVVALARRPVFAEETMLARDPLLLVAPAATLALLARTHPQPLLARNDAIGILALVFVAIGIAEVLNPLDGGVVPGAVGFLYSVSPLLWFWVGSALGTRNVIDRLGRMSVTIGACVAIYGLYQVQIGFPPWDAARTTKSLVRANDPRNAPVIAADARGYRGVAQ